jgi:hypothetical protein
MDRCWSHSNHAIDGVLQKIRKLESLQEIITETIGRLHFDAAPVDFSAVMLPICHLKESEAACEQETSLSDYLSEKYI